MKKVEIRKIAVPYAFKLPDGRVLFRIMVDDGRIQDAKTLIALLMLKDRLS